MIKQFLFLILIPIFLFSCRLNNKPLPQKEMEQILLDVNIAESYSSLLKDSLHRVGMKNIDSLSVYYKEIFAHYKITPEQFSQSMEWYKAHPEDMDSIYAKIIQKAMVLQNKSPK